MVAEGLSSEARPSNFALHRSETLAARIADYPRFAMKFSIRDDGLIGQLVNDIVRFRRAAAGQSNAKDVALAHRLPARPSIGCASSRHENCT